jgi:hypothetical protein
MSGGHRDTHGTFWERLAMADETLAKEERYKRENEDSIRRLQEKYPGRKYEHRNNIGRRTLNEA